MIPADRRQCLTDLVVDILLDTVVDELGDHTTRHRADHNRRQQRRREESYASPTPPPNRSLTAALVAVCRTATLPSSACVTRMTPSTATSFS